MEIFFKILSLLECVDKSSRERIEEPAGRSPQITIFISLYLVLHCVVSLPCHHIDHQFSSSCEHPLFTSIQFLTNHIALSYRNFCVLHFYFLEGLHYVKD